MQLSADDGEKFCREMIDKLEKTCPDDQACFIVIMAHSPNHDLPSKKGSAVHCSTNMCPEDAVKTMRDMALTAEMSHHGN